MKKLLLSLGTFSSVAMPIATSVSCESTDDPTYFYEIIIDPVTREGSMLVHIFHLPTESDHSFSEDFREKYWSMLYDDLSKKIASKPHLSLVNNLFIEYSSLDHSDTGGSVLWGLDFSQADLLMSLTIPEHTAFFGEKIYEVDEDGFEVLVETTEKTLAPERVFYLRNLSSLFLDEISSFVDKNSLLLVPPHSQINPPTLWSVKGYLIRTLFQQHLEKT